MILLLWSSVSDGKLEAIMIKSEVGKRDDKKDEIIIIIIISPYPQVPSKNTEVIICEGGSLVVIVRKWLDETYASSLCQYLSTTLQCPQQDRGQKCCPKLCRERRCWNVQDIVVGGRTVQQARRTYACGDGESHRYSGSQITLQPWIPALKSLLGDVTNATSFWLGWMMGAEMAKRDEVRQILKETKYNSCLLNEYKDGKAHIGYHSDKEVKRDLKGVVSVSLGGSRDFYFKNKVDNTRIVKTSLHNGDLCLMLGECQRYWLHSVPKRAWGQYRISATWRQLETK